MRQKHFEHSPSSGGVSESGVRTATDVQGVSGAGEPNGEQVGRSSGYHSYDVQPSATALLNSPEPFRVMEPLRRKSEPPDAADSVVIRRGQRLEQKARHAERLLQQLPENDRRRRLLHAAIVRRDEVLLDGFIAELGG